MKKLNKTTRKKLLAIFLLVVSLYAVRSPLNASLAATPTPSTNRISTDSAEMEKIQKIKDIVADKVSKLKLVEKRGIIGQIREVSDSEVVINDIKGSIRKIEIDELTKFDLGTDEDSEGISDLEKGQTYSYVGLYNKETQKLLAREVTTTNTIPVYFEGAISSVDEDNFQLVVVNDKGEKKTIDIQSSTKTSLASAEGDLLRSGFSKINPNERVLAIGFWDKKDANMLAATRVIHFSDVPPSKEMQSHITTASSSAR